MTIDATSIGLIIAAIAGGSVLVIKAFSDKQIAVINAMKADVEIVKHATNSINSRNEAIIASQEIQLAMLREALSKSESRARELAQTVAPVAPAVKVEP